MNYPNRFDVSQQHILPPEHVDWLHRQGEACSGGIDSSRIDRRGCLRRDGSPRYRLIRLVHLTPDLHLGDYRETRSMTRVVNDYSVRRLRAIIRTRSVSLQPSHCLTSKALSPRIISWPTRGADGVVLNTNSPRTYLGYPAYHSLMDDLNRHRAVVFVHTVELAGESVRDLPSFAMDFLLGSTRAICNLVKNNLPRRYLDLKLDLSHTDGFLPSCPNGSRSR